MCGYEQNGLAHYVINLVCGTISFEGQEIPLKYLFDKIPKQFAESD